VLLLAGALDGKFAALAEHMATAIGPRAQVALVPDAGHAAHLEYPGRVSPLIERFLDQHAGPGPGPEAQGPGT
jgi:2-succinyl-6-hydroxy-2,4-cyclohexadiene-1-carboxylate synthase